MKWTATIIDPKKMRFEIQKDTKAGYYLYVWENEEGIDDQLQDSLDIAMDCAFDDYGVPKTAWKRVE